MTNLPWQDICGLHLTILRSKTRLTTFPLSMISSDIDTTGITPSSPAAAVTATPIPKSAHHMARCKLVVASGLIYYQPKGRKGKQRAANWTHGGIVHEKQSILGLSGRPRRRPVVVLAPKEEQRITGCTKKVDIMQNSWFSLTKTCSIASCQTSLHSLFGNSR